MASGNDSTELVKIRKDFCCLCDMDRWHRECKSVLTLNFVRHSRV